MAITLRVRALRQAAGMTQDALAELSGVSRITINRIESGRTSRVELDTLERLARALGVRAGYLIVDEE